MEFVHKSVLFDETIKSLNIDKNKIFADGTAGGGGHSKEIAKGAKRLIAIDQDPDAIKVLHERLDDLGNVTIVQNNFENIKSILEELNIDGIDGMLLDLGVSSFQLDTAERGFSFHKDAPLDMRMSKHGMSAKDVVNNYSEEELADILFRYGEAIRIEVNGELDKLSHTLDDALDCLNSGGRLSIITFHSLEDRMVKEKFNKWANPCTCPKEFPVCVCGKKPLGKALKAVAPSEAELEENPRARSSRLRTFEKY
jgi:16S rRNA (cytosine1402-N4)-methyltransferase